MFSPVITTIIKPQKREKQLPQSLEIPTNAISEREQMTILITGPNKAELRISNNNTKLYTALKRKFPLLSQRFEVHSLSSKERVRKCAVMRMTEHTSKTAVCCGFVVKKDIPSAVCQMFCTSLGETCCLPFVLCFL